MDGVREATSLKPERDSEVFNRGTAAAKLGRVEDALRLFQRAASMNPEVSTYFQALADAWEHKGAKGKAIRALERALALLEGDSALRVRERIRKLQGSRRVGP